jgi:hypothetical protein
MRLAIKSSVIENQSRASLHPVNSQMIEHFNTIHHILQTASMKDIIVLYKDHSASPEAAGSGRFRETIMIFSPKGIQTWIIL